MLTFLSKDFGRNGRDEYERDRDRGGERERDMGGE
jgi:hypothetical protein